jgi:putative glutathione S-transferase
MLLPPFLFLLLGLLLKYYWQTGNAEKITNWVAPGDHSGEFKRGASAFRDHISKKPGAQYPPEKGRYHLYVSYACPWGTNALAVQLSPC